MERPERAARFSREIWRWFAAHKRSLPWRDLAVHDDTERAYAILVSEVMLQQTQVPRVEGAFRRFLERFPTVASLAEASNREVILAWRGMGYNSRALRLRDAAREIVGRFGGAFPRDLASLRSIPGVGPYTAAAIRNFAFNLPTPCIDTNIRRILHRVFVGPENPDGTPKRSDRQMLPLAGHVLSIALEPTHDSRATTHSTKDWHAALMDFGSLVCKTSNPRCSACPLARAGTCRSAFRFKPNKKVDRKSPREPGRFVGTQFTPNRIVRGRIVEELRDAHRGLTPAQIGPRIAVDWDSALHRSWLQGILRKLVADRLLERRTRKFFLKS